MVLSLGLKMFFRTTQLNTAQRCLITLQFCKDYATQNRDNDFVPQTNSLSICIETQCDLKDLCKSMQTSNFQSEN